MAFVEVTNPWLLIITVLLATAAGTMLPDLDTSLRLGHRSALLHSVLPMCIALLDLRTHPVAAGLGFGVSFHLAADLSPRTMRGFATIKLPLWGSIGVFPSYVWIVANLAVNAIVGLGVLERIATRQITASALAAVGMLGILYLMRTEGGWRALAGLSFVGWLFLR